MNTCTCTNPNHNHGACTPDIDAVRYCPTCYDQGKRVLMERHGNAWICTKQRTEDRRISDSLRQSIRDMAMDRTWPVPF